MAVPYELLVEEDFNLGTETVEVTNPAGGTQTGHQVGLRTWHPYSVHYFGATGDGSTDDTAAIQRAINACSQNGGGIVWVPNGTYRCTSRLRITSSGVKVIGESKLDAILVWDDVADYGLYIDTAGTAPVTSAFTSDGALGDRTVAVASGTSFKAGQWVVADDSATNTTALQTRVKSVSGNNVTLEDALPGPLTVGATAQLLAYTLYPLLTGIGVRTVTLKCATTTPTAFLGPLFLSRIDDVDVVRCVLNGSVGPVVTTRQLYGGRIRNNRILNALTVAGTGIESQTATTGLLVTNNEVTMCQFGITFASAPYCRTIGNRVNGRQTSVALGRGIRYGSSSNFGVIEGNTVSDTNLYGIYCQDSSFCSVTGNTVSMTGSASDTGEHGIQCGGQDAGNLCNHNTVTGNTVTKCSGYGITLANTTNGQDTFHTVAGNVISQCAWGGILCTGNGNTIAGNSFGAPGATVIGAIIRITFTGDYNSVTGNTMRNEDTNSTSAINSAGGGGHNEFWGNVITTPTYLSNTFHATDTIGASRAYVDAAILRAPLLNVTEVATAADTLETTAWSIPIPAAKLSAATHGVRIRAAFKMAANTNNKTLRFEIGANTFTGVAGGAGFSAALYSLVMDALVIWTSSTTAKVWVFWNPTQVATSFTTPGGTWSTVTGIDWTTGFNILLTMQNGTANAGDLTFGMGSLEYVGVPQGT
jgi:parallel beta-helix repeat protein